MEVYFSRVDLLVNDMKRSLAFYGLLGFSFDERDSEQKYVEKKMPSGFRISWCQREIIDALVPGSPPCGHRVELAFRCEGRGGVDRAYRYIIDAGYASVRAPFDAPWGQRYAFVEDPDGNLVGLEEYGG